MNIPRMEIYLNDQLGVSIANVKGGERPPLVIDLDSAEFAAGSDAEAAQRLGSVIIATLKLWHPKEMAEILQR